MKLPALITTDVHLTANPLDEYRWSLFPWLKQEAKANRCRSVSILGDLTDAKDYHSSVLTNRVVDSITSLLEVVPEVNILQGNHDYLKDGHPFFYFLNSIPGVRFITKPWSDLDDGLPCLWLPHSKNPARDWNDLVNLDWYSHMFMHQTFSGSVASNGQEMDGDGVERLHWFGSGKELPIIYSGDIHVPQKLGLVEYVGSPYHVHFGDKFDPRCLLLDLQGKPRDLKFSTISRTSIKITSQTDLRKLDAREGDQFKVKVLLEQSEQHAWASVRRAVEHWAEKKGVKLCGLSVEVAKSRRRLQTKTDAGVLSPTDTVFQYVDHEDLGASAYEAAMEVLES